MLAIFRYSTKHANLGGGGATAPYIINGCLCIAIYKTSYKQKSNVLCIIA